MNKNRQAYQLSEQGVTFAEIGDRQGVSTSTARRRAIRHAEDEGLDWPPRPRIGETAHRLRQAGHCYKAIGEMLAVSANAARVAADYYRTSRSISPARLPTMGERAYWLRRAQPERTWLDIAVEVGSLANDDSATINSAKNYAGTAGLPWPPRSEATP